MVQLTETDVPGGSVIPPPSRDVSDGCRPSTLLSSSALCSSIIEISQFVIIALFLSVSWAKP